MSLFTALEDPGPSHLRPPKPAEQDSSPQACMETAGEAVSGATVNNRGGRPLRAGAGKRMLPREFINPDDAITQAEDYSASDVEDLDDYRRKGKQRRVCRNRKPPPPPPVTPVPSDPPAQSPRSSSDSPTQANSSPLAISWHLDSTAGQNGSLFIKVDIAALVNGGLNAGAGAHMPTLSPNVASLLSEALGVGADTCTPASGSSAPTPGISAQKSTSTQSMSVEHAKISTSRSRRAGFYDLPYELRSVVYRLVFVNKDKINLLKATTFPRSSAFLRTCKTVNQEGTEILYAEHQFVFQRQIRPRATYKQIHWREVGFKDIRLFLTEIGPINISLIRDIALGLEDGFRSGHPGLTLDHYRYVNDEHLFEVFRMLGRYGLLRKFRLAMNGKKTVTHRDERFLNHLKKVKADDLELVDSVAFFHGTSSAYRPPVLKIDGAAMLYLKKHMVREHELPQLEEGFLRGVEPKNAESARYQSLMTIQHTRWQA